MKEHPFSKGIPGDNYLILKLHWHIFKKYTPEQLGQFYMNLTQSILTWWGFNLLRKGPCSFPKGVITKQRKYIAKILIIFIRITRLISTELGTKRHWVKGTQGFTSKEYSIFKTVTVLWCFYLLINVMILSFVLIDFN